MKKLVICIYFIVIVSCSTFKPTKEIEVEYLKTFHNTKHMLIDKINKNDKNIDNFFTNGIRNRVIITELKKLQFNNILLIIPNKTIKITNRNELKTDLMILVGIDTYYFDVVWKKYGYIWKISSIYEKK